MDLDIVHLIGQVLTEIAKLVIQCFTVHSIRIQGGTEHIVFMLLANSSCFNAAASFCWLLSLIVGMLPLPVMPGMIPFDWHLTLGLRLILGMVFLDFAWIFVSWIR